MQPPRVLRFVLGARSERVALRAVLDRRALLDDRAVLDDRAGLVLGRRIDRPIGAVAVSAFGAPYTRAEEAGATDGTRRSRSQCRHRRCRPRP